MIARIVWIAIMAVAALATFQLQLDRETIRRPSLAPMVAGPFRANAQTIVAASALEAQSADEAVREARKLVLRRPIPAESLTMLASAQYKAEQIDEAAATIQIAARRGWREPFAQQIMAQLALGAGDMPEAARRYAALLINQSIPDELLVELGAPILAEPAGPGRRTMIAIVTDADRWRTTFLRRGPAVIDPDAFAEIATGSIERGVVFECAGLASAAKRLSQSDRQAASRLVAASEGLCPQIALD